MAKRIVFAACVAGAVWANGIFIPRPPAPEGPAAQPAAVRNVTLKVEIRDQAAHTAVEETFFNPNDFPLEGAFVLPIPPEARIDAFTFFMDGKEVRGEILSREDAQRYYRDIVARLIDPALLEYMDKGLVRVRMFPIPARGEGKVRFAYTQILSSEAGQLAYYYPFGTNKFSSAPLEQAVIDIAVRSSVPLKVIYSPRYEVDVARRGETEARVSFERRGFLPADDFVLYIGRTEADFGVASIAHRTGSEDGYVLLAVAPKQEFGPGGIQPKDIVFVLDVSGSMAMDRKLQQAKEALCFCVRALSPEDRFNLVAFSTAARRFKPGLADAGGRAEKEALEFIDGLEAVGGTNIDDALETALRLRPEEGERPFMVVFLTDGQPTIGVTDPAAIVQNVARRRSGALRLFVFGVGDDVNTVLLDRLAGENGGTRRYVRPGENLEAGISAFYQQIARPVLSQVTLNFSKGGVYDLCPPKITDIFHGSQIILTGRYREPGEQVLEIAGTCAGKTYSYRFPIALKAEDAEASYLPRLWATRKIGYLLDEIRLHGGQSELIEEVKTLARRYGIVTPYTSYFVHDDKALVRGGGPRAAAAPRAGGEGERGLRAPDADGAPGGMALAPSGARAVERSETLARLKDRTLALPEEGAAGGARAAEEGIRVVGAKTFYLREGVWVDSLHTEGMAVRTIAYLSPEYFDCLAAQPELGRYFALGKEVLVCLGGVAYRVTAEPPAR
ncbi:MAG TPA: VIT and VWA domain-containing protein [Planctomycetota bacterium]|jgi:Ca-activated chloride channel family protein|nr:VWA domain-containing protein [Planctomycetota bacterium]OQC19900.1 MAG: von Willebrand factor type A domain protein [Planctomycetes bacterium ADurb.Bin069]HNR99809.1 VIT and VWA domain-containing protein [Planctomycetota bacterium]HNU26282.1 VIT and VWA domain-containing protein [Planctomycetota bacterium]HOE28895.1 VIT and VWA domain-containing protein [Planctomycetota bacterium]